MSGPALWRLDWAFVSPRVDLHRQSVQDPPAALSTHRLIELDLSLPASGTTAPATEKDRS